MANFKKNYKNDGEFRQANHLKTELGYYKPTEIGFVVLSALKLNFNDLVNAYKDPGINCKFTTLEHLVIGSLIKDAENQSIQNFEKLLAIILPKSSPEIVMRFFNENQQSPQEQLQRARAMLQKLEENFKTENTKNMSLDPAKTLENLND